MADNPAGGDAHAARQKQQREKQLEQREARLAEALRANLRRRKQQARGRSQPQDEAQPGGNAGPKPQIRED